MAGRSRHQRAWPRLQKDLDWYFEERSNPSVRDVLSGLGVRKADDDDRVGVGMPSRSSAPLGSSPKLQKLAAIGLGLGRLPEWQRRKIEVAWVFRRQYLWWASQCKNHRRCSTQWIPSANPEHVVLGLSAREIRMIASEFRENYRRAYRSPGAQQGLSLLDEMRSAGWPIRPVGLSSEGLR